jgi:hypothetical protein
MRTGTNTAKPLKGSFQPFSPLMESENTNNIKKER